MAADGRRNGAEIAPDAGAFKWETVRVDRFRQARRQFLPFAPAAGFGTVAAVTAAASIAMSHKPYVAFLSSDDLHQRTDEYICLMRAGGRPNAALLGEVMNHFTRDSLNAFMLQPIEHLGISGGQRRLVEFAADTVQKSTQVVLKATLHKLDHDQHRNSAAYMDSLRLQLPHPEQADDAWFVSFEAPDDFATRARASMARARNEGPQAELRETIHVMKTLTDLALLNYYERPLGILRFGPIMRKITDVAVSTVRKGTHSTIESLIPKLDEDQLLKGIDYFDSLLIDVAPERQRRVS
jgi:hypothetical protein